MKRRNYFLESKNGKCLTSGWMPCNDIPQPSSLMVFPIPSGLILTSLIPILRQLHTTWLNPATDPMCSAEILISQDQADWVATYIQWYIHLFSPFSISTILTLWILMTKEDLVLRHSWPETHGNLNIRRCINENQCIWICWEEKILEGTVFTSCCKSA